MIASGSYPFNTRDGVTTHCLLYDKRVGSIESHYKDMGELVALRLISLHTWDTILYYINLKTLSIQLLSPPNFSFESIPYLRWSCLPLVTCNTHRFLSLQTMMHFFFTLTFWFLEIVSCYGSLSGHKFLIILTQPSDC